MLFYAPWCPHCKKLKQVWENLAKIAAFFNVYAFNCEKFKAHLAKIQSDMPNLIQGFPTIIIYKHSNPVEKVGETESEREVSHLVNACMRVCGESK